MLKANTLIDTFHLLFVTPNPAPFDPLHPFFGHQLTSQTSCLTVSTSPSFHQYIDLCTCPNHLNLASLTNSFLILTILVNPKEELLLCPFSTFKVVLDC